MIGIDEQAAAKRSRWRSFLEKVAYAFMISLATLAVLIAATAIYRGYFRDAPVKVIVLDQPPKFPVCPGTRMDVSNMITVERATILMIVISVMNETTDYNVPFTSQALEPRPHPHPAVFQQDIPWQVPNLPPGKYNRTIAMRGHDPDENPVFLHQPFTVGENC